MGRPWNADAFMFSGQLDFFFLFFGARKLR